MIAVWFRIILLILNLYETCFTCTRVSQVSLKCKPSIALIITIIFGRWKVQTGKAKIRLIRFLFKFVDSHRNNLRLLLYFTQFSLQKSQIRFTSRCLIKARTRQTDELINFTGWLSILNQGKFYCSFDSAVLEADCTFSRFLLWKLHRYNVQCDTLLLHVIWS